MIRNGIIVKWAVPFIWTRKHICKTIWNIINTILDTYFPQWLICPLNHSLKIITVVVIKFVNIVKVHIWAMLVTINETCCLPVWKWYVNIIIYYYQEDYVRACHIYQRSTYNGRGVTAVYLRIISRLDRCDCLSYMEVISSNLDSSICEGVCQGDPYFLTNIDMESNR